MNRVAQLLADLDQLSKESSLVYSQLVKPGWNGPLHGMPETLYGYVMGAFAKLDFASRYRVGRKKGLRNNEQTDADGEDDEQTERMVSFLCKYGQTDRAATWVAIQIWRHQLMHTGAPRPIYNKREKIEHRWLLHWNDEHLPRSEHFVFRDEKQVLGMSLEGLLSDLRIAFTSCAHELEHEPSLQTK